MGRAPWSTSKPELSTGHSLVTHSSVMPSPFQPFTSVTFGARSLSMIVALPSLWPVTTRRIFCTMLSSSLSSATASRLHDPIAQDADFFDFELHDVVRLEKSHLLEAATIPDGAGPEELARMQRRRARRVRDAIFEFPMHVAGIAAAPFLAVHPHGHVETIGVADLVGGDQARSHGVAAVEILAFARS